jgi:hypothetical protein
MKGYHDGAFVLIQGVVQRDRADHLKGFESIEHVTPLDPLDVVLRLEELATLKNGWLDGKGLAPSEDKLRLLADLFDDYFDQSLPLPHLYPTAEGRVEAEWSRNNWEISLEIDLEKQHGEYQALNVEDNSCTEFTVSLGDQSGWNTLNEELRSKVEES